MPLFKGGYVGLLVENPSVHVLFWGSLVSTVGDYFGFVATMTLLSNLGATPTVIGWYLAVCDLAPVTMAVPSGLAIDTFDPKFSMIAADVVRCLATIGILLVSKPAWLWVIFVMTYFKYAAQNFFLPARQALLPRLVSKDDLVVANTLDSFSTALMTVVASSVGGLVTELYSPRTSLAVDAFTFFVSAVLVCLLFLAYFTPKSKTRRRSSGNETYFRVGQEEEEEEEGGGGKEGGKEGDEGVKKGTENEDDRVAEGDEGKDGSRLAGGHKQRSQDKVVQESSSLEEDHDEGGLRPMTIIGVGSAEPHITVHSHTSAHSQSSGPPPSSNHHHHHHHNHDDQVKEDESSTGSEEGNSTKAKASGPPWRMTMEAILYMRNSPAVMYVILVKCFINVTLGGVDVVNVYIANNVFTLGREDGSLALGLAYAMEGVASLIAPLVVRYFFGVRPTALHMAKLIGYGLMVAALGQLLMGLMVSAELWLVGATVFAFGNTWLYVYVTTLQQIVVHEDYMGRVFSLGYSLRCIAHGLGSVLMGQFLRMFEPRGALMVYTVYLLVVGGLWFWKGVALFDEGGVGYSSLSEGAGGRESSDRVGSDNKDSPTENTLVVGGENECGGNGQGTPAQDDDDRV